MKKIALTLVAALFSMSMYSQSNSANTSSPIHYQSGLITLEQLVNTIKSENESLKNVKAVNVMVNDLLIEDLGEYVINPKNIAQQEILVLNTNGANRASIIINTKNRQQITKL